MCCELITIRTVYSVCDEVQQSVKCEGMGRVQCEGVCYVEVCVV